MAAKRINVLLAIVIVAAGITMSSAQSSCSTVIISLSPCLDYVTGNSSTPSSGCCTQFATVVRSQPQCLCQVINGGSSSLGINLNQTQALALPSACKVETPPISHCIAASPTDTPSGTSGTGSKNIPSPGADSSASKFSTSLVFLYISMTTYALISATIF
ncbi:hypothetical protein DCAR_0521090 [Daucus carota subsp. sativus]|uniref:Uncharacterized protein n=1 Tax=Daucus carota subsp. sativus TaxID=79200 RepID=A0A164Z1S1_DAUCS|nr:PREDICTED: non-specific lipid-transfer protein-like protein At2g13820 [Daucus carota subsp. sativus]WOH01705.1 hypothetical protein DCAR_0521090 [Daucus carota subsp. sativus]